MGSSSPARTAAGKSVDGASGLTYSAVAHLGHVNGGSGGGGKHRSMASYGSCQSFDELLAGAAGGGSVGVGGGAPGTDVFMEEDEEVREVWNWY